MPAFVGRQAGISWMLGLGILTSKTTPLIPAFAGRQATLLRGNTSELIYFSMINTNCRAAYGLPNHRARLSDGPRDLVCREPEVRRVCFSHSSLFFPDYVPPYNSSLPAYVGNLLLSERRLPELTPCLGTQAGISKYLDAKVQEQVRGS